jgi:hypothetical protein
MQKDHGHDQAKESERAPQDGRDDHQEDKRNEHAETMIDKGWTVEATDNQ